MDFLAPRGTFWADSAGELGTKWRLQKLYRTLSESLAHAPSTDVGGGPI
eukprot:COSAG03_NODE_6158_length_1104_cov_35.757214_2_plen_48_part_01